MQEEYVKIKKSELITLLESQYTLNALEAGGVDNWSFYGENFQEYMEEILEEFSDDKQWFVDKFGQNFEDELYFDMLAEYEAENYYDVVD